MEYTVEVVKYGNPEEVVKRMGPMSERKAERVESGLDINLDHENYFSRTVPHKELEG